MDLNYLFYRQQVERSRAAAGANEPARKAHEQLALKYEEQIEELTPEEFHFPFPPEEIQDDGFRSASSNQTSS